MTTMLKDLEEKVKAQQLMNAQDLIRLDGLLQLYKSALEDIKKEL
jgi:hypothetical protein